MKISHKLKITLYIAVFSAVCVALFTGSLQITNLKGNSVQLQNISAKQQYRRNLESADDIRNRVCKGAKDVSKLSSDEKETAKNFITDVRKSYRSENRMKKLITEKSPDYAEEGKQLIPIVLPYAVFAVLSFLGIWTYLYCCCCPDSCCPPCKCCANPEGKCCGYQCDQREPFKGFKLYFPIVGMLVCMLYIIIVSIIGLANTNAFEEGYDAMRCSLIDTLYSLNYKQENWIGLSGFETGLKDLVDNMETTYKPQVTATFNQNTDWIQNDQDTMNADINVMETNYVTNGVTYDATTKTLTYNTIAKVGGGPRPSCFFSPTIGQTNADPCFNFIPENKWQALTKAMSLIVNGAIKSTLDATKGVSEAGKSISTSIDSFSSALTSGLKSIKDVQKNINKSIEDLDKALKKVGDILQNNVTPSLTAAFGVFIALCILLSVALILIIVFKAYKLRIFIHTCWFFFIFLAFILFLISAIFIAVSVSGMEICDFLNDALNNKTEFDKISELKGDIKKNLITCKSQLGGNGKIIDNFDIRSQLDKLNVLDDKFKTLDTETEKGNKGLTDLQTQLEGVKTFLNTLRDTASIGDINDNFDIAEAQTQIQTAGRVCYGGANSDVWVKDQTQCGGNTPLIADHKYVDNVGNEQSMQGNKQIANQCIWWNGHPVPGPGVTQDLLNANDFPKVGMYRDVGSTQVQAGANARYEGVAGDCVTARDRVAQLMLWRTTKNSLTALKKNQNQKFLNDFTAFKTNYNDYINKLKSFRTTTNSLTKSITDDEEGLLADSKTNCLFVGKKLDGVYNGACSIFFPKFYKFTQIIIAFSFGLFFSSFFMYMTAMRYSKNASFKVFKDINPQDTEKGLGRPALQNPPCLNPDGTPVVQQFVNSDGTARLNPDGTPMFAMVDNQGNPILDANGYPVDPKSYLQQDHNYQRVDNQYDDIQDRQPKQIPE